jgi:hypothetical protein
MFIPLYEGQECSGTSMVWENRGGVAGRPLEVNSQAGLGYPLSGSLQGKDASSNPQGQ